MAARTPSISAGTRIEPHTDSGISPTKRKNDRACVGVGKALGIGPMISELPSSCSRSGLVILPIIK